MSQSPLILVWPKTQVMCRPSPVWIVNLDPAASAKSRANKLVLHRHTALMLQPATGFSSCFRYQFQTCIMSTGSSVGLKGIGREILESLLFLENLFLPQEIPKVRPNPRFCAVVMNRGLTAVSIDPGGNLRKTIFWESFLISVFLMTQPRNWLTMTVWGDRKGELALSGNSNAGGWDFQYFVLTSNTDWVLRIILQDNNSLGISPSGSGARLFCIRTHSVL